MRLPGLLFAILLIVCLAPIPCYGQTGEPHKAKEQLEPYPKHRDARNGHDHYYPDRGAILHELPRGTIGVNYAGVSYRYHEGVWFEPRGAAFLVTAPPIGLVVPTLPSYATTVAHGGDTYVYCNSTYYRPRPDLGGYEVVNDPADTTPQAAFQFVGGALPPKPTAAPAAPGTPPQSAPAQVTGPVPVPVSTAGFSAVTASQVSAPAALPAAAPSTAAAATSVPKVFLYPKNGQSTDQQARDRSECYRFAVSQSGFDPMRVTQGAPPNAELQSDYERAQGACFEARGYASR